MKILIVEDDENRIFWFKRNLIGNSLYITKETWQAIEWLKEHEFGLVFLDHDLGDEGFVDSGEGTGFEVADFMASNGLAGTRTIIHTCNPIGAVNISRVLTNYQVMPFPRLMGMEMERIL